MPYTRELIDEITVLATTDKLEVLEAYHQPEQELTLIFMAKPNAIFPDTLDVTALVNEIATGETVVQVDYQLKPKSDGMDIANISAAKLSPGKRVWTTKAAAEKSTDLGYAAMRWLLRELARDARKRGYPVTRWSSSTRISGAWAKSNFDPDGKIRSRATGGKLDEHGWEHSYGQNDHHVHAEILVEQLLS